MKASNSATASSRKTLWVGAGVFWLFLFAEVFDEVRHGHENLMLFFGAPFWLGACAITLGTVRLLWHLFPPLAPKRTRANPTHLPVLAGLFFALLVALAWGKSSLFALCYDSVKWMLLIVIAGWTLGLGYKMGGRFNVVVALAAGALSAAVALLMFFLLALSHEREKIWLATWSFARIGVPFAVAVTLYDSFRWTLASPVSEETPEHFSLKP